MSMVEQQIFYKAQEINSSAILVAQQVGFYHLSLTHKLRVSRRLTVGVFLKFVAVLINYTESQFINNLRVSTPRTVSYSPLCSPPSRQV